MATRKGPVPKRSDAKHGHRTRAEMAEIDASAPAAGVQWPEPDPEWHDVAQDWFRALGESGQAQYFEPSDVATARYVATAMSHNLGNTERFSGVLFAAVMSASGELLATEGARRRLRVELQRDRPEDDPQRRAGAAAVASLHDARSRMESRTG